MVERAEKLGLVLQGGGARGAYQVGALKAIGEIWGQRQSPFQIISGTSVGAINAAPLAAASTDFRRGTKRLEKLWSGLRCDSIFKTHPAAIAGSSARWVWSFVAGGFGMGKPCSLLDNKPLETLLNNAFQRDGIDRSIHRGALHALCITASSYGEGSSITFIEAIDGIEEWDRARRKGRRTTIGTEHLMASAALPFVFPAKRVGQRLFGDGALRLTAPLAPAIHCGAKKLLVIGVRDNEEAASVCEVPEPYPSMGDMGGHALDILFNDDLDADYERLERINHTVSLLPPEVLSQTNLREIDLCSLQPSKDLRVIAAKYKSEMPHTIRLLLKSIGAWGDDSRLISYLLFEPGYINALIELGYKDVIARRDEVAGFLQK